MAAIDDRLVDRRVYEEEIGPWLPDRIFDCHVHVGLREHLADLSPERIASNCCLLYTSPSPRD